LTNSISFQPTTAPGRGGNSAPATPVEGQPQHPSAPESSSPGPLGSATTILIFALPLLLLFLMTRNQNKKQKALEANLKVGDRVFTQSGIIGKIVRLDSPTRAKLEIASGVVVEILRSSIQGVDAGDAVADAKAGDKAKESVKDKPQEKKS
jgi:preprotein translocase subunit YajC